MSRSPSDPPAIADPTRPTAGTPRPPRPTLPTAAAMARKPRRMTTVIPARRVTIDGLDAFYGDNHAVKALHL